MCQSNPVGTTMGLTPCKPYFLCAYKENKIIEPVSEACGTELPDVIKPTARLPILGAPVGPSKQGKQSDCNGQCRSMGTACLRFNPEVPDFWNIFHVNLMIRFGLCNLHTLEWDCWILSSQLSHAHQRIVCNHLGPLYWMWCLTLIDPKVVCSLQRSLSFCRLGCERSKDPKVKLWALMCASWVTQPPNHRW